MIKITPADQAFSKCVRTRAGFKCERCGAQHDEKSMGLHCSHFWSRGNWSVRFDPLNASSLCYGCHAFLGGNPEEHRRWFYERLGRVRYEILEERKNDLKLGREMRKTKGKGEIAKHFRNELTRMLDLINEGLQPEFVGWM